jgi:hypothetical protein
MATPAMRRERKFIHGVIQKCKMEHRTRRGRVRSRLEHALGRSMTNRSSRMTIRISHAVHQQSQEREQNGQSVCIL